MCAHSIGRHGAAQVPGDVRGQVAPGRRRGAACAHAVREARRAGRAEQLQYLQEVLHRRVPRAQLAQGRGILALGTAARHAPTSGTHALVPFRI